MTTLNTYNDIKAWILFRANEATDGTSDFATAADQALIMAWQEFTTAYPWMVLIKTPPGAFNTVAAVDDTLTAAVGTGVTGTLGSSYSTSLVGLKILPGSKNYYIRITAHTPPSATITLDAVPEVLSASAVKVYQDEFDLNSDLGVFINGMWSQYGVQSLLVTEEYLRREYPGPLVAAAWPAKYFARIGKSRVRFSSFPNQVFRVEYPYCYEPADPSLTPTADLVIEPTHRMIYAQRALAELYTLKTDARAGGALQLYESRLAQAWIYEERRLRTVYGGASHVQQRGPYS